MNQLFNFINLHKGEEDREKVLENVISNVSFRGSNLWILACAIVVASIGLNVNSTAVIIGAMLISPLMGPIVGAGFGLGIFDFALLRKSLKNLLIAAGKVDNAKILAEVKILFPEISNISIAKHTFNEGTDSLKTVPVMVYQSKRKLSNDAKIKVSAWLKQKLQSKDLEIYEEQIATSKKDK